MDWGEIRWEMPLDAKPTLLQTGMGEHTPLSVETYRLDGVWCLHLYDSAGDLRLGDEWFPVRPGFVGVTPPGTDIEYRHGPDRWEARFAHFTLPASLGGAAPVLAMRDYGPDYTSFRGWFDALMRLFPTQPRRAEIKLWDLLHEVAEKSPGPAAPAALHPTVQRTLERVETSLAAPLWPAALADAAELSYTHLARLFQAQMGCTLGEHIQRRRVERAHHLLRYSTLPIKAVAAQVGLPDLHQFNKTVRRHLGRSPRRVREDEDRLRRDIRQGPAGARL